MGPPPRYGHCLGYMAGRTWLFGGTVTNGWGLLSELWEYYGTRWTERSIPNGPGGRVHAAMVYSLTRGRLVMFGGTPALSPDSARVPTAETWEFDGQSWQQRTFATS